MTQPTLAAEDLIRGYSVGAFPMADGRDGEIGWYRPEVRAILPLDRFRVRRSLAKRVRSRRFRITQDTGFERVVRACSEPRPKHPDTWISEPIIRAYTRLHMAGLAHSVEAWIDGDEEGPLLVGGLYGVALGGAFFGESMFSRAADASKVCLVHLVEHLRARGYVLLDVQFSNPHLEQFGIEEVPGAVYLRRLRAALRMPVTWS